MIPIILVVGSHKDEDGEIHKAKCETVAGLLVKQRVHHTLLLRRGPDGAVSVLVYAINRCTSADSLEYVKSAS